MEVDLRILFLPLLIFLVSSVNCFTNPNDFKILNDFRNGLENPELLKWPANGNDPCGPPAWPHVFCSNGRVTQIQVQGLGLKGPLPQNLNQLDKLWNVGLQNNKFNGKLPSFSGLSDLQFAYLDFNEFDTIPSDFFNGLSDIRVLALDGNPFNQSYGWTIPTALAECTQLMNFSCSSCNLVGEIPDFFGRFSSLTLLRLAYNKLSGEIPSSFRDSMLQILWLNDQDGGGMTGSIELIGTMIGLNEVWLHGNQFNGKIPDNIGDLTSLKELNLNSNRFVGLIPNGLANLNLQLLNLNNNMFMGPIPKFKAANVSYDSNSFCQSKPGGDCAPEVNALLDFLDDVDYPERLASQWSGNDPCIGPWWGITCNARNQVSVINLQNVGLNGTLSPSLVNLSSLLQIRLERNNLHGVVPANLTLLKSLRLLDISGNNFEPPLARFRNSVKVVIDNNPKLVLFGPTQPPSHTVGPPLSSSPGGSPGSGSKPPPSDDDRPPLDSPRSSGKGSSPSAPSELVKPEKKSNVAIIVAGATGSTCFAILAVLLAVYCLKKRERTKTGLSGIVIHPNSSSDHSNTLKIAVVDKFSALEGQNGSSGLHNTQVGDKHLIISLQVLRKATNTFATENEIGRGGFGVVYKGELEDGTKLAVKRMEATVINNKALDEFHAEIAVLSKVRQRHLVSLFGYSIEGNERLLVYEYMPQGALSRHLFRWRSLNLEPLSWARRLVIALDVARGLEYLHSLAHWSFIHRDLKPSNILLDDDFRAKVSDFGLVKLAPDRGRSVATKLAGTFGYLAPEYAVMGRITTKVDVFSFGVVLMELLTGLAALDEQRPESNRYLAEWFWQIKSNKETLIASVDPALNAKEDIHESIYIISELAGHCSNQDPNHRPEIGHAVNVLSQLVEKWAPFPDTDPGLGINLALPLPQHVKDWQESDIKDLSGTSQDSEGSIPAKPLGFADSFTSSDGR